MEGARRRTPGRGIGVKYLLDTNVLCEPVKPRPNEKVLKRLERHRREFAWAAPVLHELKYGIERLGKSSRKLALSDYLKRLDRKSTRLNSSHIQKSRMPSSA